ncbi:hypothetical protein QUF58_08785 [Anaerolineales bacterium HSG24]|nr:hypothetical protein [Anaerolineales bacterium HSG24]
MEDFYKALTAQLKANQMPATCELCHVTWADVGHTQTLIVVKRTGSEPLTNMVWFLVSLSHEGLFTFVEENVYIKPPVIPGLPALPEKPKGKKKRQPVPPAPPAPPTPTAPVIVPIMIVVIIFSGFFCSSTYSSDTQILIIMASIFVSIFAIIGFFWVQSEQKNDSYQPPEQEVNAYLQAVSDHKIAQKEVQIWNQQVDEERRIWQVANDHRIKVLAERDTIVKQWYIDAIEASRLANTDKVFQRFTVSVSKTVKQVIKTLFEDQQAKLEEREKNERTQQEIEAELEKRRQEGFK